MQYVCVCGVCVYVCLLMCNLCYYLHGMLNYDMICTIPGNVYRQVKDYIRYDREQECQ